MKKIFLFSLLFICMQVFSQTNDAAKYAATISAGDMKKYLTVIASDEMQGRETGTEGQRKAAAYIEAQFKAIGLKPAAGMNGYQQLYPLYKDSMISSKLVINDSVLVYGTDYLSPASTNETGNFSSNEVIFAGYGIEDKSYNDYESLDVKGKVILFFLGEPKKDGKYIITGSQKASEWSFQGVTKKLALAAKKGAAGVLIINPVQETFAARYVDAGKKTSVYFPRYSEVAGINYALLSHAYSKKILGPNTDSLIKNAKTSVPFDKSFLTTLNIKTTFAYDKYRTIINASNVIGIIEGTDKKDEYVFLTGHYDHLGMHDGKIYYGADDDGTGTVAVIEMAKAFLKAKANGNGPRRTLVFMTVSGEEKGLWGSEYYSDHPVYPLDKTSVDLNTDMVGRVDTERKKDDTLNYVYVVGHDKLSSDLPVINEGINKQYTNLVLDYKFDDPNDPNRIYFRSDHYNFARKGIPVLFFYDGMLKSDYHKPTDTIDKIYWPLYETRVKMIFHTAWEIANRNEMLKRDIPLPESATRGR